MTEEKPIEEIEIEQNDVTTERPKLFPPYPPYETTPLPPSVADTIIAGHEIRYQLKSVIPEPVNPPPKPAAPRGPKATDVKQPKDVTKRHLRCMRRHGGVLTDRLDRMAKPQRRKIICLWREYAEMFPPETVARLRAMLDADEPFQPGQAYQYFLNLRRSKKKSTEQTGTKALKQDILAIFGSKRTAWVRNATIVFAKGIQQRLNRPGSVTLTDGMMRLSDIILQDVCECLHMRKPSRRSTVPKAKFVMEVADKIAVWIDSILSESYDRMLMMDFDEDEEIEQYYKDEESDKENLPEPENPTKPGASPTATQKDVTFGLGDEKPQQGGTNSPVETSKTESPPNRPASPTAPPNGPASPIAPPNEPASPTAPPNEPASPTAPPNGPASPTA